MNANEKILLACIAKDLNRASRGASLDTAATRGCVEITDLCEGHFSSASRLRHDEKKNAYQDSVLTFVHESIDNQCRVQVIGW